ncbi:hypothetical protein M3Y94_00842300 [Aphelenchoides besseyi]|nr:hypothetical protein M3Y94_00842300 [Aphelenchoides besseyi]KAI6226911.1 hypothetical protein M3Y95_00671200 [Aphelenchoides besseyi]
MYRRESRRYSISTKSQSASPPNYLVAENRRGELVNPDRRLVWPEPHTPKELERTNSRFEVHTSDSREICSMSIPSKMCSRFVGVQTPKSVAEYLCPTKSILYYKRPTLIAQLNDVPVGLPLCFAYMTNDNQVRHYNVNVVRHKDEKMWQVDAEGDEQQPRFKSLKALLDYYNRFALLDEADGPAEVLPN